MKRLLILSFLSFTVLLASAGHLAAQIAKNSFCPVMLRTRVKEKFYADYQGRKIYFCCRSCIKSFQKHPEKYLKNLEVPID